MTTLPQAIDLNASMVTENDVNMLKCAGRAENYNEKIKSLLLTVDVDTKYIPYKYISVQKCLDRVATNIIISAKSINTILLSINNDTIDDKMIPALLQSVANLFDDNFTLIDVIKTFLENGQNATIIQRNIYNILGTVASSMISKNLKITPSPFKDIIGAPVTGGGGKKKTGKKQKAGNCW